MTSSRSENVETVGFVGLGNMGRPMVEGLVEAGFEPSVWNRNPIKLRGLPAACFLATSVAEVAQRSHVVVSCLYDDVAVRSVYLGDAGLLLNAAPGTTFVEHGTITPALANHLHAVAEANGSHFVDAPVTGGPEAAKSRTLVTMAGGDRVAIERAAHVMRAYSESVTVVGPSGSGLMLKLVNQVLVTCNTVAAAEALMLVESMGIDFDVAHSVLGRGWGSSRMLERALDIARKPEKGKVSGAPLGGLLHLQPLLHEVAANHGVALEMTGSAGKQLERAVNLGGGSADLGALALVLRGDLGGPQLKKEIESAHD